MPGWKTFIIAILSGAGLALFFTVFWRWPAAVGLGVGVLTSAVVLLTSVSFGIDPARADRAWREAAPDLAEPRAGPRPDDEASNRDPAAGRDRDAHHGPQRPFPRARR